MNRKLIRVERTISIYDKNDDELKKEVFIDIPLEKLLDIITPIEDDINLYRPYELNVKQMLEINQLIEQEIQPNFDDEVYFLEIFGIYE